MKKIFNISFITILTLFFVGCGLSKQVTAEYYLQEKKFDKGFKHFQKKVNKNSNDSLSQYYYGRFLLTKAKNKQAIVHLKKAVELDNKKADYYSWLGVAYSKIRDYKNERKQYKKALEIDKKHIQSLTYLAHNYYGAKEYKKALEYYTKSLKVYPENKTALFNRAMTFHKLKRKAEEKSAWLIYLEHYPSGILAQNAVKYLNYLGDFNYQNHIIGIYTITLKNITFEPFSSKIKLESKSSLDVLSKVLEKNKKFDLHIVSYLVKNDQLSKQRAKSIKKYLLSRSDKIDSKRIKLSWFNRTKNVKISNKKYTLFEYVDFITASNNYK